jgi:hypothetical protein
MGVRQAEFSHVANESGWSLPDWIMLAALGLLIVAVRFHAFDLPLENDEANYAYTAGRLLEGDRLYVDIWDHQPYGVFLTWAGLISLFGNADIVFRLASAFCVVISGWLLYGIVRGFCGWRGATLGGVMFALGCAAPGMAGEGCNREIFMNLFALAAVWKLSGDLGARNILSAGMLLGICSAFKTVAAAQWIALAVGLVLQPEDGGKARTKARRLLIFAAGPALIWTLSFAYFAVTDRWNEFINAVFLYNLEYSKGSGGLVRFIDFFRHLPGRNIWDGTWIVWILAGIGIVIVAANSISARVEDSIRPQASSPGLIVAYLVGSYFAVCLPGQFWHHYYLLMWPSLVMVVAFAACMIRRRVVFRASGIVVVVLLALCQWPTYFSRTGLDITEFRYHGQDYWGRVQGRTLARVTDPGDEVFVYGNHAGVYHYSRRKCASRFTMVGALKGDDQASLEKRLLLLNELETRRPRVIMLADLPFEELGKFLGLHYVQAPGGFDMHDERPSDMIMIVWMDPQRPIESADWNWNRHEMSSSNHNSLKSKEAK